jgi:transketolase
MRDAFANEITTMADEDGRIVLLSGDIGNRMFNKLKERHPDRFYNCGVAEANMMGMAAGMAMCGLRPVIYTIVPFATTRCLEQIRVDACYHHQPVVVVGTGGGLSYASLGATHHSCEDIGFLRMLPTMTVVCPGDPEEVKGCIRAAVQQNGPVYVRLGKKGEPVVHASTPQITLGKSIRLRKGNDVTILSTGNILPVAVRAAEDLEKKGLSVGLESFHTVKPLDEQCLEDVFSRCKIVATVEEHSRLGGAGGAVAEWLADHPHSASRLLRFGTADEFMHEAGSQEHARKFYGLTSEKLVAAILASLGKSS